MPLVEVTGGEFGAEHLGDGVRLGPVVERGRGAVGVDVADLVRRDAGVLHGQGHAGGRPGPAGDRGGDVVGVGGAGRAGQLTVDAGPAGDGVVPASSTRAPAPSVITKPSRRMSKGREIPEVDRAVMLAKAAMPTPVIPASAAPPMATSHRPDATSRAAWPMLWAPAAQAVVMVSDGPCQPMRMETAAAPALDIIIGHQPGRDPPGALLAEDQDLGLQGLEAADPGPHDHAGAPRVGVDLAGVLEGHGGHGHAELGEPVQLAGLLGGEPALGVEVGDPPLTDRGRSVEPGPQRLGARRRSTRRRRCR